MDPFHSILEGHTFTEIIETKLNDKITVGVNLFFQRIYLF